MNIDQCPNPYKVIDQSDNYIFLEKTNHRGIWYLSVPYGFWNRFVSDPQWRSHMSSRYAKLVHPSASLHAKAMKFFKNNYTPEEMFKTGVIPPNEKTAVSIYWNLPGGWFKEKESISEITVSRVAWEYEHKGFGLIEITVPSSLWKRFCGDNSWQNLMDEKYGKLKYLRRGGEDGENVPAPEWHLNRDGIIPKSEPLAFSSFWNCPKGYKVIDEDFDFIVLQYNYRYVSNKNLVESIQKIYVPKIIWERFTSDLVFRKNLQATFSIDITNSETVFTRPRIEDYAPIINDLNTNGLYWNTPLYHKILEESPNHVLVQYDYHNIGESKYQELFSELQLRIPAKYWSRYCTDDKWRMEIIRRFSKLIKLYVPKEKYSKYLQNSDESGVVPDNLDF